MKRRLALISLLLLPLLASCEPTTEKAKAVDVPEKPKVLFKTNMGEFVVQLDGKKAPITTKNFLSYVEKKHYDGTVFHRVISNFMIQGGGFTIDDGRFSEKPTGAPIKNESDNGLKNDRGTIAMARTNAPDSATSQFFINVKDNESLNYPSMGGYAVFGKVIKGMDVVDKIRDLKTGAFPPFPTDAPQKPAIIESATVVTE